MPDLNINEIFDIRPNDEKEDKNTFVKTYFKTKILNN